MGEPYSQKNDIWSLGVLLYEMVEGSAPFHGESREQVLLSIRSDIAFSSKFSEEEVSLVRSILRLHPYSRPEVVQILKHSYFQGQSDPLFLANTLGELPSPYNSSRIKLLEVKFVKTKPE